MLLRNALEKCRKQKVSEVGQSYVCLLGKRRDPEPEGKEQRDIKQGLLTDNLKVQLTKAVLNFKDKGERPLSNYSVEYFLLLNYVTQEILY